MEFPARESFPDPSFPKTGLWILLDPDRDADFPHRNPSQFQAWERLCTGFLIGGSLLMQPLDRLHHLFGNLRKQTRKPIYLFPGGSEQLTLLTSELWKQSGVHGVLYLVLLDVRMPEWGWHTLVRTAPLLYRERNRKGHNVIPVGYIPVHVESSRLPSRTLHWIAGVSGVPAVRPDLAEVLIQMAILLRFPVVYLDAGSGASEPPPAEWFQHLAQYRQEIHLVYGGGIRTVEHLERVVNAQFHGVVMGTSVVENLLSPEEAARILV